MFDTFEIVAGDMIVMNADGDVLEQHRAPASYRLAKKMLMAWVAKHTIVVCEAYNLLHDYFEEIHQI
jgi:hypothetical protein